MRRLFLITATLIVLALLNSPLHAQPVYKLELLPKLSDVTIKSVTQ